MKSKNSKPKSKLKRIKESITEVEYKKLINAVRGDESLRPNTKDNLLRVFTILYFTGLRLNELQELRLQHIKELLDNSETKLILPKTKSERKLFAGDEFKKQLKKLFVFDSDTDIQIKVISKGSSQSKKESIHPLTFIAQVNEVMKQILGSGYTSHSFRQGLISEMASKQINTKIISKFIGHSDVKTTMGYIKPTDDDVKGAMIR
ncbi:tyrosine-type recombinase/integrase [Aliarcobacter cryaerophilus]|uniref:tyrosine-type recombinase/integrase n=1 Tax=Aliarcobacter cryaerophilus TaxID=28198 RepID=UPI0021B21F89|nr:site-specific integrase [Aliarcobacter cryaerophilus]MCT7508621.1 site-specific integrase [Aliarcobacter cryaerophilus]